MSGKKSQNKARGECLCGAVKFEIDLPPKWCAYCHCSLCRRAHGADYVTWVGVESDHFRLLSGDEELVDYESSPEAKREFCMICGSTLFFESERWAGEKHVVLANFKDDVGMKPLTHVYYSDKAPWVEVKDGLPKRGGKNGMEPLE